MRGLAVIVRNEEQFNKIKEFLGNEVLYLNWVPQMEDVETSVVIWYDDESFLSIGSVGSTVFQRDSGVRCVEFSDYFK